LKKKVSETNIEVDAPPVRTQPRPRPKAVRRPNASPSPSQPSTTTTSPSSSSPSSTPVTPISAPTTQTRKQTTVSENIPAYVPIPISPRESLENNPPKTNQISPRVSPREISSKPVDELKRAESLSNIITQEDKKWKIDFSELEFSNSISEGSAGEVFLGYYLGTPVAIKKLFQLVEEQKHLVMREYSMLKNVNHPNIVQFLGLCDDVSGVYLVTEYVEQGDLFDLLIFGDKNLDWKIKVKIGLQIAQACLYLHSKQVIHRDLKSQNVLVAENFKVKLCDLGLATLIENQKRTTVCGTDQWMAPEITFSDSYDYKIDVFSFGMVLTELIFQQPPAKRSFQQRLAFDDANFKAQVPQNCPQLLTDLVLECCRYDPTKRPTFKEIVPRLRELMESLE